MLLTIAPPAQANRNTCQSYVLAAALSMLSTDRTLPWFNINDADSFRTNELEIRKFIENEMRVRLRKQKLEAKDDSIRDDWKNVLQRLTFGQYKIEKRTFISHEAMMSFLAERVQVKRKGDVLSQLLVPHPTTLYFTSVSRIGTTTYKSGHVVIILGVDMPEHANYAKPALLFLNSFVKGDDNECLPKELADTKWFGSAGWTDDYEIKFFPGKDGPGGYIVNWIEPAHSVEQ